MIWLNLPMHCLHYIISDVRFTWQNVTKWYWIHIEIILSSMVVRVFIQKRSYTWSRLIKKQYLWDIPQKIVWQVEWLKKPWTPYFFTLNKNIETVGLSLWNDCILAFICLNGLKTSGFNVMTQYFHQNIPSA
jgi:hypothetical protein